MTTDKKMILTPFRKAVLSLEEAFLQTKNVWVRDATIQRFAYTYELAIRMMQRYFQQKGLVGTNVDAMTYNDLCRIAAEAELIDDPRSWFAYRDARNITSPAYDEDKAEKVYSVAQKFLEDAKALLAALESRV